MLLLLRPRTRSNTRQTGTRIITSSGVDQIHIVNCSIPLCEIILNNTKTIDPQISFTYLCRKEHGVCDNSWKLISRHPKAAGSLKMLDGASICTHGLTITPYIA